MRPVATAAELVEPAAEPVLRPWTWWLFRAAVTLVALLALGQAILAGGFLAGHYDMLVMHRENGNFVGYAVLVQLVAAILVWRPGGGPSWPVWVSLLTFVAIAFEIFLGFSRIIAIHVPLGVTIIASVVVLLVWVWRPIPGREAAQ